jgi:hypothetical protein
VYSFGIRIDWRGVQLAQGRLHPKSRSSQRHRSTFDAGLCGLHPTESGQVPASLVTAGKPVVDFEDTVKLPQRTGVNTVDAELLLE